MEIWKKQRLYSISTIFIFLFWTKKTNKITKQVKEGKLNTTKVLLLTIVAIIMSNLRLFPIIYGSVSGVVTEEETGKGISEVTVYLNGRGNFQAETDKEGKFTIKLLKPGKYVIAFSPLFPHCCLFRGTIVIEPGKNVIFDAIVKLAGTIKGKVLYRDGKEPFPGVSIHAWGWNAGMAQGLSNEEGSYFLGVDNGRLCPSAQYYIEAKCNIPNIAYKVLLGVNVEKGKEVEAKDILFDLNDPTGIEGYITSSLDGKPLNNIQISIYLKNKKYPQTDRDVEMGDVFTDSAGYYYIKNLEPGIYWIYILPQIKDEWNDYEFSALCKEKSDILVTIGEKIRIDSQLDIPSSNISENGEENE